MIKLFVSHSSKDLGMAQLITDLLFSQHYLWNLTTSDAPAFLGLNSVQGLMFPHCPSGKAA